MSDLAFLSELLETAERGEIVDVLVGLHWTAVVAEVKGERRCGLASTIAGDEHRHGEGDVPAAGRLQARPAAEVAALVRSEHPLLAGIGLAALNALLPPRPEQWVTLNKGIL